MERSLSLMILSSNPQSRDNLLAQLAPLKSEFSSLELIPIDLDGLVFKLHDAAQGLIVDVDDWMPQHEAIVPKLRDVGYKGPILVLAKRDPNRLTGASKVADEVIFLDKPFNPKEMVGFARRMVLAPIIAHRKYRRHDTNETGEVKVENRDLSVPCIVRNISKGGAFVELAYAVALQVGDGVSLTVQLGNVRKSHVVRSRVAWISSKRTSVGLEFIKPLGT